MSALKEKMLKVVVKAADKAVEGASGSKSAWWSHELEMPQVLKQAKFKK